MGLIKQNSSQYYTGSQSYTPDGTNSNALTWPSVMTPLIWDAAATATSFNNYKVFINNVEQHPTLSPYYITQSLATTIVDGVQTQILTLTSTADPSTGVITPIPTNAILTVKLTNPSLWDNYKSYQYVNLKDIVNNFMVAYVGVDKIIPRVKRSDVIFHAKRGLQEFSYDTLRSVKSQELTIPPNLSLVLPQDYVNYVQLSWIDGLGVKHIIYPTTLTSNPSQVPLQDNNGLPMQDIYSNLAQSTQSLTNDRWRNADQTALNGQLDVNNFTDADVYNWGWWKMAYGQRFGLDPEVSQKMDGSL